MVMELGSGIRCWWLTCVGDRCSRNCVDCPVCETGLQLTQNTSVNSHESREDAGEDGGGGNGYLLFCQYCAWTTQEIGVVLKRSTKVVEQLARQRKARLLGSSDTEERRESNIAEEQASGQEHGCASKEAIVEARIHEDAFEKLGAFYKDQLSESGDAQAPFGNSNYSSPANLARIMSLYGGLSYGALKKSREKPQPMREALNHSEGFATYTATGEDDEADIIKKMQSTGWNGTASETQRLSAPSNQTARFTDDLWPMPTKLRTKRGKRCRSCRQFIIRPESKVSSTRYKIRIIAHNHIPRLSLKPFNATTAAPTTARNSSFILRSDQKYEEPLLTPNVPQQYILTLRNPIFEVVKITLATPAVTPGRVKSKVTILCNEFTLGPAGDSWDDALSSSTSSSRPPDAGGRREAMASLTGEGDRQPEAGKVWEKRRNETSVVLEIVPGDLLAGQDMQEDEDVLGVPIYVRAEWMADVHGGTGSAVGAEGKGEREAREVGYWCVLGVGRIVTQS